jgi:hypothetical protein
LIFGRRYIDNGTDEDYDEDEMGIFLIIKCRAASQLET